MQFHFHNSKGSEWLTLVTKVVECVIKICKNHSMCLSIPIDLNPKSEGIITSFTVFFSH